MAQGPFLFQILRDHLPEAGGGPVLWNVPSLNNLALSS